MNQNIESPTNLIKDSLQGNKIDVLIFAISYEIPRTSEFSEYDERRVLPVEGTSLLSAAIGAVARKNEPGILVTGGLPQGVDRIPEFRELLSVVDSYDQAILGMRRLIDNRLDETRNEWEQISGRRLRESKTLTPDEESQTNQIRWKFGIEGEYEWFMRRVGFDLALRFMGIEQDSKGGLVPTPRISKEVVLQEIRKLPTREQFQKSQFDRVVAQEGQDETQS